MKTCCTGTRAGVWTMILAIGLLSACAEKRTGTPLPDDSFQFPTSLAVHPNGYALVVCSNFDLAFSSGSLRVIDLNRLAAKDLSSIPVDSDYHQDVIRTDLALGLDNFGSSISLSDDGLQAAITVRETDELVLADLNLPPAGDSASASISCWDSGRRPNEDFPFCEGSRHLIPMMYMLVDKMRNPDMDYDLTPFILRDPIDVLLTGSADNRTAVLTFLGSGYVTGVKLPSGADTAGSQAELAFSLNTQMRGLNEMAKSSSTGLVFVTTRSGISSSTPNNTIHFFDPDLGASASLRSIDLYNDYLGNESRGIAFGPDGYLMGLLVRNPDILLLLDTAPDTTGIPKMGFLGAIPVTNDPTLLRSHGELMFVTGTKDDSIFVIDINSRKLVSRLETVCRGPFDMAFYDNMDTQWALVSCFESDNVAVLDVAPDSPTYLEVVARIGRPVDKK